MNQTAHSHLTLRHFSLALAVVFIWGTNFVVIKEVLHVLPPLLFATLRFTFVFFPAIFFIKKPPVAWGNLAAYGVLIGAGQFGLLFLAMKGHITPGLASLVVQLQVFFTIGLSMAMTGERMKAYQIPALLLAVAGIVVICVHTNASTSVLGLALVIAAGFSWAVGNMVSKLAAQNGKKINMLAYIVWSAPFAALCLAGLTIFFEGAAAIRAGLVSTGFAEWLAIAWQATGNSLFGYAVWAWLLSRYPASAVTPMALLVPVFGMGASALWLHEPMPAWKLEAGVMVIAGLAVNLFWPRLVSIKRTSRENV